MAAKKYFIRYLEGRDNLLVSSSATMIFHKSFNAGCKIARNTGYDRKADALRNIEDVNKAAGKVIAVYAGAFVPPPGWEGYELAAPVDGARAGVVEARGGMFATPAAV